MCTWRVPLLLLLACGLVACSDDDGQANDNNLNNDNGNQVQPQCGDGVVNGAEACDDGAGNSDVAPDACRTDCVEAHCGDGVADSGEACDEGAANSAVEPDACRPLCVAPTCGDGVVDSGEACDDGDLDPGDGCAATCAVEHGFGCGGSPSVCAATCGDGLIAATEGCDDGGVADGDGCTGACAREVGPWECAGEPTRCTRVIHVTVGGTGDGETWGTALGDLDAALDAAEALGPGTEVWIAAGTYPLTASLSLRSGIALVGSFTGAEASADERTVDPASTVLDGQDVTRVLEGTGVQDVRLDGLTLARGRAPDQPSGSHGGALRLDGAEVVIERCVLRDSLAQFGGAVSVTTSTVTLRGCELVDNVAVFMDMLGGGGQGGGLFADTSQVQLVSCVLARNQIVDAGAGSGGGGLFVTGGSATLTNCTLVRNSANAAGAVLDDTGTVDLHNSVIYHNAPDQPQDLTALSATFCNLEGSGPVPGTFGNFGSDPGFVDLDAGDYRLTASSANIDRCSDALAPPVDLLGLPRVEIPDVGTPGTLCDVGAYEYQP